MVQRETMEYEVVIVGAGPAGLSAAIRLKQLSPNASICIVEKGAEVGAHILSGAVFEPTALNELLPDWQQHNFPIKQPVTNDYFYFLTQKRKVRLPVPATLHNQGNFIISLGDLCRSLATYAEELGVEIYPGFAATEILYDDYSNVIGVLTGDMGLNKQHERTTNYQPGIELRARQTLFAEGCRGSLTKQLEQRFNLRRDACPQTYGLGFKEVWRVKQNVPGTVIHTIGWPLDFKTYGGSFLYHFDEDKVSLGFVVGLDYCNPWLNPFEEFQRFKTHPAVRYLLEGGERLTYGAKAISEGGYQAIPKLTFPGGMLIGDSAGFLNVAKIKGSHTAMKSGMIAAEIIADHLTKTTTAPLELVEFRTQLQKSWLMNELYQVRNVRPAFHHGLIPGLVYSAIDQYVLRGKAPWTLRFDEDHIKIRAAEVMPKINYPKPDGKLTFDKLSSVYLAGTYHDEDQPVHLKLNDERLAIEINYKKFNSPETRYCPAGVYEIVEKADEPHLQINAQNCIHCKTCDIKDPYQNITWVPPEGGGGPNYKSM